MTLYSEFGSERGSGGGCQALEMIGCVDFLRRRMAGFVLNKTNHAEAKPCNLVAGGVRIRCRGQK